MDMEVTENWVDDDRVSCKTCVEGTEQKLAHRMPADDFEKIRRVNHEGNRWMFDVVTIDNGWASAKYTMRVCKATTHPCLPDDLKHRCHLYRDVSDTSTISKVGDREGGAGWWE
jgi:hypothetical protein